MNIVIETKINSRKNLFYRVRQAWKVLFKGTEKQINLTNQNSVELVEVDNNLKGRKGENEIYFKTLSNEALKEARKKWNEGDLIGLSSIKLEDIQHHPERAKIALLASAGHFHKVDQVKLNEFLSQAIKWGANEQQIKNILVAGVYKTLSKANMHANKFNTSQTQILKSELIANIKNSK